MFSFNEAVQYVTISLIHYNQVKDYMHVYRRHNTRVCVLGHLTYLATNTTSKTNLIVML